MISQSRVVFCPWDKAVLSWIDSLRLGTLTSPRSCVHLLLVLTLLRKSRVNGRRCRLGFWSLVIPGRDIHWSSSNYTCLEHTRKRLTASLDTPWEQTQVRGRRASFHCSTTRESKRIVVFAHASQAFEPWAQIFTVKKCIGKSLNVVEEKNF